MRTIILATALATIVGVANAQFSPFPTMSPGYPTSNSLPASVLQSQTLTTCYGNTGNQAIPAATTVFYAPEGNSITNLFTTDTSTVTRSLTASSTTISSLYCLVSGNPGAFANSITVMTNGVASNITVAMNNVTSGNDVAHSVVVPAGTEIGVKVVAAASSTPVKWSWAFLAK